MSTVDEDLNQVERDIRTLKIEYEQFFGGGRPRAPADTQWRVESMMRRYNERTAEISFAQRFRFNNLAQTYAKYVDMWRKKTLAKEGVQQHHFGSAAKAIEAERARIAAAVAGLRGEAPAGDSSPEERASEIRETAEAFAMSFSDPEQEKEKVEQLYEKLISARSQTGEASGAPTLNAFERFVRKKTGELKNQGAQEVEYSVSIEAGRVKLRARVSA